MKKAQTEIIGLIVIVILFIIIFFFYVGLSGNSQDERELRESLEASNFLRAMMFYTPVGCDKQIKEIAESCSENEQICGNNCKDLLKKEIENILETLERKHDFSLEASSYMYRSQGINCRTGLADSYKTREIEAKLVIC